MKSSSTKLLVTGGAGFIGSNFIRYWFKKYPQDQIINLDKLTYAGHLSSTKDFDTNKNYQFIKGDICDEKVVKEAMENVDIVVHFAAESHVDRSIRDPQVFLETNVLGTHTLLDQAVKKKVKRFHHISTDEVFGSLPLDSHLKFTPQSNYDPRSPYSASKAASDHLVRSYFHTFDLPVTITNCSNNYGPFQDPEKLLPRVITNIINGQPVPIYGDGKYVRDWLYVDDHCRAIDLSIKKGKPGETYLIGGLTKDINNLEIIKLILKIMGQDDSSIKFVKDRSGHDRRYAIDWTQSRKKLGWSPENQLERYLELTVKWYQDNQSWWSPLKKEAESLYKKTNQL
jgi:dTDP-glucose 4,6-dehydratase